MTLRASEKSSPVKQEPAAFQGQHLLASAALSEQQWMVA